MFYRKGGACRTREHDNICSGDLLFDATTNSRTGCFIINIPIGVVGVILAHFILRRELLGPQEITRTDGSSEPEVPSSTLARLSTFDFGGQLLFLFGTVLLILALTWAGAYYPWSDGKIIAPLVIGLILLGAFIGWEYLMIPGHALAIRYPYQRPMIPLKLLCRRNVGILFYTNFSAGMCKWLNQSQPLITGY